MNRMWLLLLGATATMTFALVTLVLVPRSLFARMEPPPELPMYTSAQSEGRHVYASLGCVYCHSQQVRDSTFTYDARRGWGRPSVPADYFYDDPHLLGTMRTGPDLFNVATRLPDRSWHLLHLYDPRLVVDWSIMPSFPFLFTWKRMPGPGDEVVRVPDHVARPGWVLVAKPDASALVDYLLSLDRSYPPPAAGGAGASATEASR